MDGFIQLSIYLYHNSLQMLGTFVKIPQLNYFMLFLNL